MGIGPAARSLYETLRLKPPASVCDIGSQEMSTGTAHAGSAREWMELQGFDYTCIDMDGKFGALKLDLNVATVNDVHWEMDQVISFDIVTNHGTTEHVFNQANVFKLIHDMTKLGGLMIHAVPSPFFGKPHGFYFYDETIFNDLAHANHYEIHQMYRASSPAEPHELIMVAMEKRYKDNFKMPIQGLYR